MSIAHTILIIIGVYKNGNCNDACNVNNIFNIVNYFTAVAIYYYY